MNFIVKFEYLEIYMIQHFLKIENLGVFSNYKKPAGMEPFKRFNLIYGLNGSGKTTLSRFFADLNTGQAEGFPNLKYKIKTEDGDFQQGAPYSRKIRVFNAEYVDANIGKLEGTLNPIYVIGEENKALAETVKSDEAQLALLKQQLEEKSSERDKLVKKKGKLFTDVAPKITEASKGAVTRTYNKRNAEKAYGELSSAKQLSIDELAVTSAEMKQTALDRLDEFPTVKMETHKGEQTLFEALKLLRDVILNLGRKSATSAAIERIKTNPELADWVERGRDLHDRKDDQICEYCLQKIPEDREAELAAHFNESDSKLKLEIESAISSVRTARDKIERIKGLSEKNLYPELQEEFSKNSKVLSEEQAQILSNLKEMDEALKDKLTRRTESYEVMISALSSSTWEAAVEALNTLIRRHNAETDDYQNRLDSNFSKIETHFLSAIQQDVQDVSDEISVLDGEIKACIGGDAKHSTLGTKDLETRIKDNRARISNSHQAAADLSQKLASFLGRDDLRFEPEGEGYRVMRFGRAAKRLSEGEKTAITFLYFVVGLNDQDFDLEDGIVVIDDPISSLDSSSVYQAFSYLKSAVKDARQVFLLTHNFEFLKLLLGWFTYGNQKDKSYWMLHCTNTSPGARETDLKPLDKVLIENRNEYIYLFRTLAEFVSDGTIAQSYPIPNIARKVLETFLDQHSTGKSFFKKLENLDYDEQIKSSLYKYTNDLSHPTMSGLDPALVGETQTNIKHLLEMIQTVAPVHYKALTGAES